MRQFIMVFKMEFILFVREFFGIFFTFAFPLLMLLLYGGIYGNQLIPVAPGVSVGFMDLSVPGYSVMVIGVTGLMCFPLTLAEYKEKKIYKRFDASPAGKGRIIQGQIAVNVLMTLVGILILLIAGSLLFHIHILGSLLSILIATLLSIAAMYSMGFLFTALGRDAKITNLMCYLFYFVMIFLSGATVPRASFPHAMLTVSNLLPMTYAVNLMQGIYGGQSFSQHGTDLAVLACVTLICAVIGGLLYRKKDWA